MSQTPYTLFTPPSNLVPEWDEEASAWDQLAKGVLIEGSTDPLTVKALYVTGLVIHSCLSVNILLAPTNLISTTYYAAYSVFASAVELIGRCIRGNRTARETGRDLAAGFKWVAQPIASEYAQVPDDFCLLRTSNYPYSISDLVALRHFSAHGQAINPSKIRDFDYLVLAAVQPPFAAGIQAYLEQLASLAQMAANLARSSIAPFRNRPVFDAVWPFPADGHAFPASVGDAIRRMDWSYKDPLARLLSNQ